MLGFGASYIRDLTVGVLCDTMMQYFIFLWLYQLIFYSAMFFYDLNIFFLKIVSWQICSPLLGSQSWYQWLNSLWPGDAIWWRSGLALAQILALCWMAPSHYLYQCWKIISEVLWHSSEGSFTWNAQDIWNKRHMKMLSTKKRPVCLGFSVLTHNCTSPRFIYFYLILHHL